MTNTATVITSNIASTAPTYSVPDFSTFSTCNHFSIPKEKTVSANPLYTSAGVKKCKAAEPIRKLSEVQSMIEWLRTTGHNDPAYRNSTLFFFGINTGLRFQSLASIKVSDVMTPNRNIRDSFDVYEQKTKKRNSRVLSPEVKAELKQYIDYFNFMPDHYLFPNINNYSKPIQRSNYYTKLSQAKNALGLPYNIGTHSMRKTFGYWIIKSNPFDVNTMNCLMSLFNHSSLAVTLAYSGITKEDSNNMCMNLSSLYVKGIEPDKQSSDSKIDRILSILTEEDEGDDDELNK